MDIQAAHFYNKVVLFTTHSIALPRCSLSKKSTDELNHVLRETSFRDLPQVLKEYETDLMDGSKSFSEYMRTMFRMKHKRQQDIFLQADISERYGYKLISGERRTRQRDIILRICYAAEFTYEETQKALRLYRMPELYAKDARDAALIVMFMNRPGSVLDVNTCLRKAGFAILKPCGTSQ